MLLYEKDSHKTFRIMLLSYLNSFKNAFYKKVIPNENELKRLLERCKEDGFCEKKEITEIYKMIKKIERQLEYIEINDYKFQFGRKDYGKALEKIWKDVNHFNDEVNLVNSEILVKLSEFKIFRNYVFEKCILGY